jgi:ABC-2 type transport system ATP-binding protein
VTVPALSIKNLCKRYGDLIAVDGISLEVAAGDFFGLLGPNGAGKTTTINAIVGLARPSSGSIAVFGHDTVSDWRAARRLIGLAPQEYNFDRYLSIRDILIYQAGYFGLRARDVRARADDLLERFDLSSKAKEPYTRLSGGMKRRLTLARALIHEPKLLILDEPTAGVDVELRIELWELLRSLNAGGMTIVLTTHYLEEAQELCREIAIVESGRIVARETTQNLLARRGANELRVTLAVSPEGLSSAITALGGRIERGPLPGDAPLVVFGGIEPHGIGAALGAIDAAGLRVADVEYRHPNLQDVFLELVKR